MKTVGLFEAKTKLSEICLEVAEAGEVYTITRRGTPLVQIVPVTRTDSTVTVWQALAEWKRVHGALAEDFEPPPRTADADSYRNPLDHG